MTQGYTKVLVLLILNIFLWAWSAEYFQAKNILYPLFRDKCLIKGGPLIFFLPIAHHFPLLVSFGATRFFPIQSYHSTYYPLIVSKPGHISVRIHTYFFLCSVTISREKSFKNKLRITSIMMDGVGISMLQHR